MRHESEIRRDLAQFIGTESYHRLTLFPWLVGTDGVAFLAKEAECFWLIDIIASYQPQAMKDEMLRQIQFWKIEVTEDKRGVRSAVVRCLRDSRDEEEEGSTDDVAFTQKIDSTDFPFDEFTLYVAPGEAGGRMVMVCMLTSEY